LLHSLLASLRAKAIVEQWFGASNTHWYRLTYNLLAVLLLIPVLALIVFLPDQTLYRFSQPWRTLAFVGQACAALLAVYTLLRTDLSDFMGLGRALGKIPNPADELVIDGAYAWVRHPLYFAGLIYLWLSPSMTINRLAFYAALSIYIVIGAVFEERKLLIAFGQSYAIYQKRVPMLIPGFKRQSDQSD